MKNLGYVINKVLFYGLLIMGIILVFFGTGRISTTLTAFGSFIASFIISNFIKNKKIPKNYELLINLALWLNLLGEIIFYYGGVLYYDKILHLTLGIFLSSILYVYYSNNLKKDKLMIFFGVLGILALWEVYEYAIQIFFNFPAMGLVRNGVFIQSPFDDTMYDLIFGMFGSLIFLFFKKESADRIIEEEIKILKKKK
ncbi:MAG: hypothetical protein WCX73_05965 [Candidatus Pacearchaeota archaeon]